MMDPLRFATVNVVAYHDHCTDGIAAAAVASLTFGTQHTKYVPVNYNQPLPAEVLAGGKRILFVDWCPEPEQIEQIEADWDDWFVIDHHKGRDWIATKFPEHSCFSLDRSGAALTWEWIHGDDVGLPAIVAYVQDRDLWTWALPHSREVSAALGEEPKTVERWRDLVLMNSKWIDNLAQDGALLLKSRTRAAQSLAEKSFEAARDGFVFRMVNATANLSEVGEEILKAFPNCEVACAFFLIGLDFVQLSFRSRAHQPGSITALAVAKSFGGGGHEHAAGARVQTRHLLNQVNI